MDGFFFSFPYCSSLLNKDEIVYFCHSNPRMERKWADAQFLANNESKINFENAARTLMIMKPVYRMISCFTSSDFICIATKVLDDIMIIMSVEQGRS